MAPVHARAALESMLAPEVLRGLPLDINRPFGEGVDNDKNGIVDEMGERDTLKHVDGTVMGFDHDNDAVVDEVDPATGAFTVKDFDSSQSRSVLACLLYTSPSPRDRG